MAKLKLEWIALECPTCHRTGMGDARHITDGEETGESYDVGNLSDGFLIAHNGTTLGTVAIRWARAGQSSVSNLVPQR
jgi:hypothetical protein